MKSIKVSMKLRELRIEIEILFAGCTFNKYFVNDFTSLQMEYSDNNNFN